MNQSPRWTLARGVVACARCSSTIAAGDPVRRMTKHDWPYCVGCAKATLDEDPPEVVPVRAPDPILDIPESFKRFNRPGTAQTVRENVLDWRAKQAGEP